MDTPRTIPLLAAPLVLLTAATGCIDLDLELAGCEFPVDARESAIYDPRIVGTWRAVAEGEGQPPGSVVIESSNRPAYTLRFDEELTIEAFAVEVDGVRILNMKIADLPWYFHFRYDLPAEDRLTLRALEGPLQVEAPFDSQQAFLEYVRANLHDEAFYAEPQTLVRERP